MSASIQQQFTTWVRSKNPDEVYDAWDSQQCALAQFGTLGLNAESCEQRGVPLAVYYAAVERPWTFGALAARLEGLAS
jgi:hypothetical protein